MLFPLPSPYSTLSVVHTCFLRWTWAWLGKPLSIINLSPHHPHLFDNVRHFIFSQWWSLQFGQCRYFDQFKLAVGIGAWIALFCFLFVGIQWGLLKTFYSEVAILSAALFLPWLLWCALEVFVVYIWNRLPHPGSSYVDYLSGIKNWPEEWMKVLVVRGFYNGEVVALKEWRDLFVSKQSLASLSAFFDRTFVLQRQKYSPELVALLEHYHLSNCVSPPSVQKLSPSRL